MHKIFKLCGSPCDDYWQKTKLPLATSFKPQQPYKRVLLETFKNLPSSALALVDKLLSLEPEKRGTASSTLSSKVALYFLHLAVLYLPPQCKLNSSFVFFFFSL